MPPENYYRALQVLEELNQQEQAIFTHVQAAGGSLAEINRQLQQEGIFGAYRRIHSAYADLARHHRNRAIRNEALKRGLFLSWYSEVEPAAFSGLADLDEEQIEELYIRLNYVLEKGWLTEELSWMLQHYAHWEWIILQYTENKLHPLSNWIKALDPEADSLPYGKLPKGSMEGRGLMGRYFQQLGLAAQ